MSYQNKIEILNTDIGYELKKIDKILLSNLNITALKGELIALIGVNGAGKSTFLRTLANLQNALSGIIKIDQKNINSLKSIEMAKKVSFVSSERINTGFLKVKDLTGLGRFPHQKFSNKLSEIDKQIIEKSLEKTGMTDFKEKHVNEISDGEKQKVMIARAFAQDTEIILLDEPTAFLDISNKLEVLNILSDTCKHEKKTIIFSTHDLNIALKLADKVWFIHDKQIIESGPEDLMMTQTFKEIFNNENIRFNKLTTEFEIKTQKKYPIKIINRTDSDFKYLLTQNALKRKGYYNLESEESLRLEIHNNQWFLNIEKNKYKYKNLYNLIKKLSVMNI